ncbi:MAG: PorV/PorQ family protein [Elusimicrobiota bacterium]|nr:PorV/PorQ family protein [Elusimicrobiota bacterium]
MKKTEIKKIEIKRLWRAELVRLIVVAQFIGLLCLINQATTYAMGNTSAEFLLIPKAARTSAMAGAASAIADDSTAIFYNPAGIGFLKEKNVSLSHSEWLEDINFESISYSMPVKNKFSLGLGFEYLGIGNIQGQESMNSPTRKFNSYDFSSIVGLSYLFNKNFSVGGAVRYIEEKIDDEKTWAGSFDIGTIYRKKINSHKNFSLGVTAQNIALKKPQFIAQKEELPTKIVVGGSYKPLGETLLLSTDLVMLKNSKPAVNFGCEVLIYDILKIRSGYKLDPAYETSSRLTLGMGIIFNSLSVDYAYIPFESLTDTHIFSINYKFD